MDKTFYRMSLRVLILVTGSMGLFACSSSDEPEAPAKPLDPTNTVKTQFAISVPRSASGGSRMSAVNTQNNGNFLGIDGIMLFPTAETDIAENTALSTRINLPAIAENSDAQKVYNDVVIPVGVKSFLFYGHAPALSGSEGGSLKESNPPYSKASDISFSLESIVSTETANFAVNQDAFVAYLNTILNAKATIDGEEISWVSLITKNLATTNVDGNFLKERAVEFTKNKAGSATAIKNSVEVLYNSVNSIAVADGAYKSLASAIQTAITAKYFNSGAADEQGRISLSWKADTDTKVNTFPESFFVPQGAVGLSFKDSQFVAANDIEYGATGEGTQGLNISKVTYPASLYYWVNTPIRTSDASSFDAWPTSATDWVNDEKWTGTWGTEVVASTRKIALKNNINYGVGNFVTTVKCGVANLSDNATYYNDQDGNKITIATSVPVGDGFPIKGIIVGGQPESVSWNFLNTSPSAHNATIYDSKVPDGWKAGYSATPLNLVPNYTLVLDNEIDGDAQADVWVAIELENHTGIKFYGQDGIVYPGSRFYMLAQLKPQEAAEEPATTSDHVFKQDYKTIANFTIKSLEKAYVTIPDLRTTQLQLGLSVDLEWQQGLTFNADL